jgi:hypothetical protein
MVKFNFFLSAYIFCNLSQHSERGGYLTSDDYSLHINYISKEGNNSLLDCLVYCNRLEK